LLRHFKLGKNPATEMAWKCYGRKQSIEPGWIEIAHLSARSLVITLTELSTVHRCWKQDSI